MAHISAKDNNKVLEIHRFLGLNENADGDTNLKIGELAKMRNFRITHDYHLQKRPGMKTMMDLRKEWDKAPNPGVSEPRACGMWEGLVSNVQHLVCAFGGKVYDIQREFASVREIGTLTQDDTTFFGFGGNLYLLNGHEYMVWDGGSTTKFKDVEPYIPTIQTATDQEGKGTPLENVNRLTEKRKVNYASTYAEGKDSRRYVFPESGVTDPVFPSFGSPWEFSYTPGENYFYLKIRGAHSNTFPAFTVTYSKGSAPIGGVKQMRYAELYNGTNDSRVFLYGDGSNKCIYSGVDLEKATPAANYFPDLYEAQIGDKNSPVTALCRHYGKLLAFKPEESWTLDYQVLKTATGVTFPGFTVTPVNRQIGNVPMGQVRIIENNPLSVMDSNVFRWQATGNLAADHRNAERISSRVTDSLRTMDEKRMKTFNDIEHSEFWFWVDGQALILNYANDTWYRYTDIPFHSMALIEGGVYGLADNGKIMHFHRRYHGDEDRPIDMWAETGSMDFSKDYMLKYSPLIWVSMQPEGGARCYVTVESNRRSDYPDKLVAYSLSTFLHADFAHWSFGTNRKPQITRVKMKVKKAAFYKLIYFDKSSSSTATILGTDIQLRFAGKAK